MKWVVALVAVAGLSSVAGTDAAFDARTRSSESVSLLAVGAPSALAVQPLGNDVSMSWGAGEHATGYDVRAGDTCGGMASIAQPTTTSHTDTPAVAAGSSRCYGVVTTSGSWSSMTGNPAVVVRVGFLATAVSIVEGQCGTSGVLDCGDAVVVQFNQPAQPVSPDAVCATGGTIVVGCEASVGTLAGGTLDADARYAATSAWSNGNRMLTVTVGTRTEGTADPAMAGPWTLTPAGLTSATGAVPVCDTAGDCRPSTS